MTQTSDKDPSNVISNFDALFALAWGLSERARECEEVHRAIEREGPKPPKSGHHFFSPGVMEGVKHSIELAGWKDRQRTALVGCAVFAVLALESAINHYIVLQEGQQSFKKIEQTNIYSKWFLLPAKHGAPLSDGLLNEIWALNKLRNAIVHDKPVLGPYRPTVGPDGEIEEGPWPDEKPTLATLQSHSPVRTLIKAVQHLMDSLPAHMRDLNTDKPVFSAFTRPS